MDRGRTRPTIDMDSEDFLELIWGERKGWVDVPAKLNGNWISYHTLWDGNGCANAISRRIDSSLRDGEDLYFSVGMFSKRGRHDEDLLKTEWLWADCDLVHPNEAGKYGLTPTVAWLSSRGRYQALWRLDRRVGAEAHDRLNQALSYKCGFDRGGWDRTQVLRIPGTRNFKYDDAPLVSLISYHPDLRYDPRKVWAAVKDAALREPVGGSGGPVSRGPMPPRAKALLRVPPDAVVEGERSSRLWELECLLAESGWGEDDIYEAVEASAWNKWATVGTGQTRLRREIRKAIRHVYTKESGAVGLDNNGTVLDREGAAEQDGDAQEPDDVWTVGDTRYDQFMATEMEETPRWLIEGIWTEGAHGILGGEPKTLKTTLALAMGMSVASGKEFLGQFPVHVAGPVLMVQEENAAWNMRDRMRKIAYSYGLIGREDVTFSPSPEGSIGSTVASVRFPDEVDFHIANQRGLDLTEEEHREKLEERVQELRPRLLILDPLTELMGNADFDRSHEIRPYLKWLRQLRFEYDMAILLVHHMRKSGAERGGQRMLGSTAFHAWTASGLYCAHMPSEDGWKQVSIEREFREQEPMSEVKVALQMGRPGDVRDFKAMVTGWNKGDQVVEIVMRNPGITVKQVAKELGVDVRTVKARARGSGRVRLEEGGGRGISSRMFLEEEGDDSSA